jgi:hypothetical protein
MQIIWQSQRCKTWHYFCDDITMTYYRTNVFLAFFTLTKRVLTYTVTQVHGHMAAGRFYFALAEYFANNGELEIGDNLNLNANLVADMYATGMRLDD